MAEGPTDTAQSIKIAKAEEAISTLKEGVKEIFREIRTIPDAVRKIITEKFRDHEMHEKHLAEDGSKKIDDCRDDRKDLHVEIAELKAWRTKMMAMIAAIGIVAGIGIPIAQWAVGLWLNS